jgi:hypothetical protein
MSEIMIAPKTQVSMSMRGIEINELGEALRFCKYYVEALMHPRGDKERQTFEAEALVKLQHGMEIGMPPMAALSQINVIKGKIALSGQALLAKVRGSGHFVKPPQIIWSGEVEKDNRVAAVVFQRVGDDEKTVVRFGASDAIRMGLWKKAGPWRDDPDMMLAWRAVARANRMYWSDITMGMNVIEEVQDFREVLAPTRHAEPQEPRREALPAAGAVDPLMSMLTAPAKQEDDKVAAEATTRQEATPNGSAQSTDRAPESPPGQSSPPQRTMTRAEIAEHNKAVLNSGIDPEGSKAGLDQHQEAAKSLAASEAKRKAKVAKAIVSNAEKPKRKTRKKTEADPESGVTVTVEASVPAAEDPRQASLLDTDTRADKTDEGGWSAPTSCPHCGTQNDSPDRFRCKNIRCNLNWMTGEFEPVDDSEPPHPADEEDLPF